MRPLAFQYSNLFRNSSVPNKDMSANLAETWLPWQRLELSEKKEGQIRDIRSNTYNLVKKNRENWSGRF